jgi:outer membrane protein OmpA-like peptidoglycan-associated protein
VGNKAVERLLKSHVIQAKLTIGQPGDVYEQEADRVAEQVMRMPDPDIAARKGVSEEHKGPNIQRMCTECEEELQGESQGVHIQRMCTDCEEELQRKTKDSELGHLELGYSSEVDPHKQTEETQVQRMCSECKEEELHRQPMEEEEELFQTKEVSGGTPEINSKTESQINSIRGGGQPLPESVRAFFEPRFGRDFSGVRVHTGSQANESAKSVNALAYTVGQDVVFGGGQYSPGTDAGKKLIAHELTHVMQQNGLGSILHRKSSIKPAVDTSEINGEGSPILVASMGGRKSLGLLSAATIQRKPDMSRAEEIRVSFTSPGEISGTLNPPMISLFNFAIDKPTLKKEHLAALQAIAFLIKLFPSAKVRVEAKGHADFTGDDVKINQPLSKNRALSVQNILQSAAGVTVVTSNCGELCPVATNDTVEGRSRNRRVDINVFSGKKPDDIDWPSLCDLVPALCHCLKNPALCGKGDGDGDGDGDGIDWPCTGPLGALICGIIVCITASAILRNPTLCLPGFPSLPELLCLLFPSLCRHKPKPPEKEKKRKACALSVGLPEGVHVIDPATAGAYLKFPFEMRLIFDQEPPDKSPYCDCNCGEYRQEVKGYFERDDETGKLKRVKHRLSKNTFLDPNVFQEDGEFGVSPPHYGHRYRDDAARRMLKAAAKAMLAKNADNDKFLDPGDKDNREDGCIYKGKDAPGVTVFHTPKEEVHFHLWFRGGPFDACNNRKIGDWKEWEVICDRIPQPPRTPRQAPISCGLPPGAKVGDIVPLFVYFHGDPANCSGKIDVRIIVLSPTELIVLTQNSGSLNIAPKGCPDIWIKPYQGWTFYGSPPCGQVA